MYTKADPILFHPFETTTATLVDTPEALDAMLVELKTAKEIAIDLEHHDNRSYIGIVSLMQISTRDKDWIVDTLVPWRRKLACLNEVFADPGILKVLHGAFMDTIWLQRDLGLYIVGLFDTHHAARALGYAGGSLAFLLLKFINFSANKQYQMADWRVRPLPTELFDYARSDTHYLLYIFDNMRNELIEKSNLADPEFDLVARVQEKSREVALQRYEHPIYDEEFGQGPGGWYRILRNTPAVFSKEQFAVFKAVHRWRDDVAREEDESVHYIMANHALLSVARAMPVEQATLLGSAAPISPVLRVRADELVARIRSTKLHAEEGPEMVTILAQIEEKQAAKRNAYLQAEVQKNPQAQPQLTVPPAAPSAVPTAAPIIPTNGTSQLRTRFSQFWGPACGSTFWDQRRSLSTSDIRLALPLPQLSAEIFADAKYVDSAPAEFDPGARAPHPFVHKKDRQSREQAGDDIFVVKQLGGGRKRKNRELDEAEDVTETPAEAPSEAGEGFDSQEEDDVDAKARRKAEKKALRKTEKAAKKAAEKTAANGGADEMDVDEDEDGEVKAFDYAAQPSVIQGPSKEERKKNRKDKKKREGVNPFAKGMDAPRGMGRTQRETVGRSKTFKG
jgi:exosome complex exonuclease RRP6